MKTLLKILGAIIVPLSIGILVTAFLMVVGIAEEDAKDYGLFYTGMSYVIYLYEVRYVKPGFNI